MIDIATHREQNTPAHNPPAGIGDQGDMCGSKALRGGTHSHSSGRTFKPLFIWDLGG